MQTFSNVIKSLENPIYVDFSVGRSYESFIKEYPRIPLQLMQNLQLGGEMQSLIHPQEM
jgi:hypothetical protein